MNLTQVTVLQQQITDGVKHLWHRIPTKYQAALVFAATASITTLGKLLFDSPACWTWHCVCHALGASFVAGGAALRAFFMRPGPGPKPPAPIPFPADTTAATS